MELLKSDFFYELPEELIAQTPVEPRSASRMMCVDRKGGGIIHDHFYNLCAAAGSFTSTATTSLK